MTKKFKNNVVVNIRYLKLLDYKTQGRLANGYDHAETRNGKIFCILGKQLSIS